MLAITSTVFPSLSITDTWEGLKEAEEHVFERRQIDFEFAQHQMIGMVWTMEHYFAQYPEAEVTFRVDVDQRFEAHYFLTVNVSHFSGEGSTQEMGPQGQNKPSTKIKKQSQPSFDLSSQFPPEVKMAFENQIVPPIRTYAALFKQGMHTFLNAKLSSFSIDISADFLSRISNDVPLNKANLRSICQKHMSSFFSSKFMEQWKIALEHHDLNQASLTAVNALSSSGAPSHYPPTVPAKLDATSGPQVDSHLDATLDSALDPTLKPSSGSGLKHKASPRL